MARIWEAVSPDPVLTQTRMLVAASGRPLDLGNGTGQTYW